MRYMNNAIFTVSKYSGNAYKWSDDGAGGVFLLVTAILNDGALEKNGDTIAWGEATGEVSREIANTDAKDIFWHGTNAFPKN